MSIKYPIFVKDRDGWVSIVNKDVNELETIDVEGSEFIACWDSYGIPLRLYLKREGKKEEIKVEQGSEIPQLDKLKEAILNYAQLSSPKVPFVYSDQPDNMVGLFKAVEEHIKAGSFRQKLKRLFRR